MGEQSKILIVDDDIISLSVLEETLSSFDTATASSGAQALLTAESFRPDIMMLDVNMPGMSGYEVCRAIRKEKNLQPMRILLVSSNISIEERLKGYEAGADDYIAKPFSPDELKAKVDVFLKLKNKNLLEETKDNLIGLFTHETRTPLGAIIGLSDLLRGDPDRDMDTRKCAQAIYENAVELHRFIEKATLLNKLKGGEYRLLRTADHVSIHLSQIARRIASFADKRDVYIKVKVSDDRELMLDWEIFDEAVGYVLENAVKYSNPGGEVVISAYETDDAFEAVVSDSGRGISVSWLENIFDEFTVQDIRHHKKGQGLSLSIVKKVIELHGGTVEVKSRVNEGTSFFIHLPLKIPSS